MQNKLILKPLTIGANFNFSRIDSLYFDHAKKETTAELNLEGNEADSYEEVIDGKSYAIEQTIKPESLGLATVRKTGEQYEIKQINFPEKRIFTACGRVYKFSQVEFKIIWNG